MVTGTIYILLSTLSVIYFGTDGVKQVITLNWSEYSGGDGGEANTPEIWANGISYMVVLFPTVTVSCAFPLYAVTLGVSIYQSLPAKLKNFRGWSENSMSLLCRLFAALPPLLLGLFLKDPSIVVNFTGLSGFFIMLFMPAGNFFSFSFSFLFLFFFLLLLLFDL
jgi:hypothetical protein